ncbi:MAG: sigma-70 family RNA polymerase sigma factor [Cyclobacteriaceae bacterium]|nr:sigma-70 family RNA polymerase sigma factor [Cyclobacteriaceae bacterium]
MTLPRDPQSFLQVIEKNKGIIYKVANGYCKDPENRKDLIQEITLQLWHSFDRYNEQYKLSTWMYRIALNVSISFYRKESRRTEISQTMPDGIINFPDGDTDELAEVAQLHQFIRELKEMDKAVILLYLDENSHQEIGDILGLSVTNVSTKIGRIKEMLRVKFSTQN